MAGFGTARWGASGQNSCPANAVMDQDGGDSSTDGGEGGSDDSPAYPPLWITYKARVLDSETGAALAGVGLTITQQRNETRCCNAEPGCTEPCQESVVNQPWHLTTDGSGLAQMTVRDYVPCYFDGDDPPCWWEHTHAGWLAPETADGAIIVRWQPGTGDITHVIYATRESQLASRFSPVLHKHGYLESQQGLGDVEETITEHASLEAFNIGGQRIYGPDYPAVPLHVTGNNCAYDSFGYRDDAVFFWVLNVDNNYIHASGSTVQPIYYHVYPYAEGVVVQYWYWFNSNDTSDQWGLGYHEGDWEHVSLYAVQSNNKWVPTVVNFYQHNGGEVIGSDDCWWSTTNESTYWQMQQGFDEGHTHLHVWLAANSHASYNRYAERYKIIADPPGGDCDFRRWDFVDYNITGNPIGSHAFFNYNTLTPMGEYVTALDAHGCDWAGHNEGPQEFLRFVGHFGKGRDECPEGCPSQICGILGATGIGNTHTSSPTAPTNEETEHNWMLCHLDPQEQRWGNEPPATVSIGFFDTPLWGDYLGRFRMCGDGSREAIAFNVPAQFGESGMAKVIRVSGNVVVEGSTSCGDGCYAINLGMPVNGKYVFSYSRISGSGSIRLAVYGGGHENAPDAFDLHADISGDCQSASAEEATLTGIPSFRVFGSVVNGGGVRMEGWVARETNAGLAIYDVAGRLVRRVDLEPGVWSFDWDCRDDRGMRVGSGIYYAAIEGKGTGRMARRVVLVR